MIHKRWNLPGYSHNPLKDLDEEELEEVIEWVIED
jgi:hypothetical protein